MPQSHGSADGPGIISRADGATIAYRKLAGARPGVMFLGGFKSDMTGTKALALEEFCRRRGRAYLRFDYRGHGASSGRFEDGTIGAWTDDAMACLDQLTEGPQVLVGSSMGGWIMLLTALRRPTRVQGLVGIAAAPDFTEDPMWGSMTPAERATLIAQGVIEQPSSYGEAPYRITRRLIDEGRHHLLLRGPIPLTVPARLLHGAGDADVPWETSMRLAERLASADVTVTLIKSGDHRFSTPADLDRLFSAVGELLDRAALPTAAEQVR